MPPPSKSPSCASDSNNMIVSNNTNDTDIWCISGVIDEDSPYTNSCLFTLDRLPLLYCCYAKTSSSAVQKRHSKVYGNPIAPSFSILLFKPFLSFILSWLKPFLSLWIRKGRTAVYPLPVSALSVSTQTISNLCIFLCISSLCILA